MGGGEDWTGPKIFPSPKSTLSYWRSQLHWVDEYCSSEELPDACDIVIIGTGLAGVSTAYHLLELHGKDPNPPSIVLLEARQVCSGATGRNGGHVKFLPSMLGPRIKEYGVEACAEINAFVMAQMFALKHVIEKEGIQCESELRRTMDVMLDDGEAETVEKDFRSQLNIGFTGIENVEHIPARVAPRLTSLRDAKGALSTSCFSLWPYKLVTQLLERTIAKGARLYTNTLVSKVQEHTEGWSTVQTTRGTIRTKKVVFATNAYTAGILPLYQDKIIPVKGACSRISVPEGKRAPYLSHTYNIRYGPGRVDYMNTRPDGGIVIGGGKWMFEKDEGSWYNNADDSTVLESARPHFDGLMQRHFTGWEDSGAYTEYFWSGIMGNTPDHMPHIGKVPETKNQFILAGFNGGGMAFIFLSALGIAKMMLHDTPFEDTGIPKSLKTTLKRLGRGKEDEILVQPLE